MRSFKLVILSGLVAMCSLSMVAADRCAKGSINVEGNYYCQPVKAVKYTNVGFSGSYQEITGMGGDGSCSTHSKHFHGALVPFNEELSLHIRGPANIKQFAVYAPKAGSEAVKRGVSNAHVGHNHHHNAAPNNAGKHDKRIGVPGGVDGQAVTWVTVTSLLTKYATTTANFESLEVCSSAESMTTHEAGTAASENIAVPTLSATTSASSLLGDTEAENAPKSKNPYKRVGYYDAASQTVDNLVFLGNYGGQGSGVFDFKFGNSQSYVNSKGTAGCASSEVLEDTVIPSAHEITIMTGEKCGEDCGFVRPGGVAYHGFAGANKVFLLEVGMPHDGNTGFQGDQPAVWFLNAKIPRTQQYGKCSCWHTGCGEVDVAEALSVGSHYLKSTIHSGSPGGDSDYFNRPTAGTATLAIIFREDAIYMGLVANLKFPTELTDDFLNKMIAENKAEESDFRIASSG